MKNELHFFCGHFISFHHFKVLGMHPEGEHGYYLFAVVAIDQEIMKVKKVCVDDHFFYVNRALNEQPVDELKAFMQKANVSKAYQFYA